MGFGGSIARNRPRDGGARGGKSTRPRRSGERSANVRALFGDPRRIADDGAPTRRAGTSGTIGCLHARRAGLVAGRLRQTGGGAGRNGKGARGRDSGLPHVLPRGGNRGQGGGSAKRAALVREGEQAPRITPAF